MPLSENGELKRQLCMGFMCNDLRAILESSHKAYFSDWLRKLLIHSWPLSGLCIHKENDISVNMPS